MGEHRFGFEGRGLPLETLDAEVLEKGEEGEVLLSFALSGSALDEAIERVGQMPLPPYIAGKRADGRARRRRLSDALRAPPGAVAAPTASLHFTPRYRRIEARDIAIEHVTLHVGAGTFLPVKAEDTKDHKMHAEWGEVSAETAQVFNAARAAAGALSPSARRACAFSKSRRGLRRNRAFAGDTSIFITPGYNFRAVDALLTNFHLPRSTLFMLVCAFSGLETMQRGLCPCDRGGLPFLQLWRRLSVVSR